MKGIQVLGILVMVYLVIHTLLQYRRGNYGLRRAFVWLALWLLIGVLFAFPPLVELVLPVLAMQDVMLATLVLGLVVVYVVVYHTYQQVARVERKLTELVQNMAIHDYVKEASNPRKEDE